MLPEDGGAWSPVYDWESQLGLTTCDPGAEEKELSHAALLPTGYHAGKVLLWRKQIDGTDCESTARSTRFYLFDPLSPASIVIINQNLDSSVFCSGTSWQDGNLLIVGGIPGNGLGAPKQTYRFHPGALEQLITVDQTTGLRFLLNSPFRQLDDMVMARYYPTVLGLNGTELMMPDTGGTVSGGSSLVIGGPRQVAAIGNRIWELNTPGSPSWSAPIANTPMVGMSIPAEVYGLHPTSSPPSHLLDSYPRAWQLRNGQVFIAGDVNTINGSTGGGQGNDPYPSPPGSAWVIEHPTLFPTNPADLEWEFWGALSSHDRFYGTAAFFHLQGGQSSDSNRALAFGGSEEDLASPGSWTVLDSVQEFEPGSNARNTSATWHDKPPLLAPRLYPNGVVLPTGEVLIIAGSREDYVAGHNATSPVDPVFWPELYEIGPTPSQPGVSNWMNMSTPTLIDPSNPGLGDNRTPRVYHSTAVLLTDGRVLVVGGEEDGFPANTYPSPIFTGEIFSPPYLFQPEFAGARPNIYGHPPSKKFNLVAGTTRTFNVDVTKTAAANTIDSLVLLRPAAVTHHFDYDQRYIELKVLQTIPNALDPADVRLVVESPQEDLGPAGYYMLFAVEMENTARVPSEAVFVQFTAAS